MQECSRKYFSVVGVAAMGVLALAGASWYLTTDTLAGAIISFACCAVVLVGALLEGLENEKAAEQERHRVAQRPEWSHYNIDLSRGQYITSEED
ncbi:MAG: hypothetical protein K5637_01825 [Lachnospiraceae bacterium]|nr:hypothetical protein [Lachnospiraceae bacterium]